MLGRYLLEIALSDYKLLKYSPSLIASAALYIVLKIKRKLPAWNENMLVSVFLITLLSQNTQNTKNLKLDLVQKNSAYYLKMLIKNQVQKV